MSKFGENLRNLRKGQGLTQEELAERLGVSKSTISYYEIGRKYPSFEMQETIADYFNISLDSLIGNQPIDYQMALSNDIAKLIFEIVKDYPNDKLLQVLKYAEFIGKE